MKRVVLVLVAALCALALVPRAAAQQAAGPASAASGAPVSSPSAAQTGPRVQPEWRSFEPTLADSTASQRASNMSSGGSHTIVISTLALILIVVIVVLLVAK
jgi:Flp pilus assembly protein TadB